MDIWYRRYTQTGIGPFFPGWSAWFRAVMEQTRNEFTNANVFNGELALGITENVTIPTGGALDGIINIPLNTTPMVSLASGQDQEVLGMRISGIEVGSIIILRNSATVRILRHFGSGFSTVLAAPFDFSGYDFKDYVLPRNGIAAFRLHDTGFGLNWRPVFISGHGGTRFRSTDIIAANAGIVGHATKMGAGQQVFVSGQISFTGASALSANDPLCYLPDASGAPGGGQNNYLPSGYTTFANYGLVGGFFDASAGTWNEVSLSVRTANTINIQQALSGAAGDYIIFNLVYDMSNTSDSMNTIP